MSILTNKYKFKAFQEGDFTSAIAEMQRWETVDAQLYALFSVMGNGTIEGWEFLEGDGLFVTIAPGKGHVAFVAVESTENVTLSLTPSTTNYVYAAIDQTSYWTKSVNFLSFVSQNLDPDLLYLGSVTTNADSVVSSGINTDERKELGFIGLIKNAVKNHRHIGGSSNPPPIDLSSEVSGVLNVDNFPDLDASMVNTGVLPTEVIPDIDHRTGLTGVGSLTHAQLDSFVEAFEIANNKLMGEVSTVNLLQLILALKHVYPDIDEFLVNEIAFIPGVSRDDYIDEINTTANVDTRTYMEGGEHKITGNPSEGTKAYVKIWDSESDFEDSTNSSILINGDSVSLAVIENTLAIDDFSGPVIDNWQIEIQNNSTIPSSLVLDGTTYVTFAYSGKLAIQAENVEARLLAKKTFDAQDWSGFKYIKMYIKTDSVQHGDLFFYINDGAYGEQNSYTKILNKNAPTTDYDTMENGWQEVIIDISSYNRASIDSIGFYVSTQEGWDTSIGFDLNIDNIILTSGQLYEDDGYIRFIFGSDFPYRFWKIRWDSIVPTDGESAGQSLQARIRVSNTEVGLSSATWQSYITVSGTEFGLTETYKYIEVEFYFLASDTKTRSITLKKAYLDFYSDDVDSSFEYTSQDDWESGILYNIDTKSTPGSIQIDGAEDVGNIVYGTNKSVVKIDEDIIEILRINGTLLPRSTYQFLNNLQPSFGQITAVSRGNYGNLWICDTDNDRVLEIDLTGNLIKGFFSSFLVENKEDDVNPLLSTSNVTSTTTTSTTTPVSLTGNVTSTTTTAIIEESPQIIQSIYNKRSGNLYIIFDGDIDISTIGTRTVKVGTKVFYLDEYLVEIAAVGFNHVVKIKLDGANKTLIDSFAIQSSPSIYITSPLQAQSVVGTVNCSFLVNNFDVEVGGNGIQVTLDGGTPANIYTESISFPGLSNGSHVVKAQLINDDLTLNTNIEAIAECNFFVNNGLIKPSITIVAPVANQVYSASPVQIDFQIDSFPIVPNGQHLQYSLDGGSAVDYYSTDPILLEDLTAGKHTVIMYLVDENGNDLEYVYTLAEVNFIVGMNSQALSNLYLTINNIRSKTPLYFYDLLFMDLYAPFDVQYIPSQVSSINETGKENILIAKLINYSVVNNLLGQ